MPIQLDAIKRTVRAVLGDYLSDSLFFFIRQRYRYNHFQPISLSQKIIWYKHNGSLEQYSKLADKHAVRELVEQTIGKEYLPQKYALYRPGDKIQLVDLPEKFVFKATHGSHMTKVVRSHETTSDLELQGLLDSWCAINLYSLTGEKQYRDIPPGVIVEEFLQDPTGDLVEYKFFCFDGVPKYLQCLTDRENGLSVTFLNLNWEKMPMKYAAYPEKNPIPKAPPTFDRMKEIATILSKQLPFIRVDLYSISDRIVFSELTLCPGNGYERIVPRSADFTLGSLWPTSSQES